MGMIGPLPPSSSNYESVLNNFSAGLPVEERSKIWKQFIEENALSSKDLTSPETFKKFVQYAQTTFDKIQADVHIPNDPEKVKLFFDLFDTIIMLMRTAQNSLVTDSKLSEFYAKTQAEYVAQMSRVPLYAGGSSSNSVINLQDLSKFTVGYNNISIAEIIQSVIATGKPFTIADASSKSTTISILNVTQNDLRYMTFEPTANGVKISFTKDTTVTQKGKVVGGGVTTQSFTVEFSAADLLQDKLNKVQSLFIEAFNKAQSTIGSLNLSIQWRYNRTHHGEKTDSKEYAQIQADYSQRAALNQRNQQFIENLRSRKESVQDRGEQVKTLLEATTSFLKGLSNILQSMIQQMRAMLDQMLKK